MTTTATHQKSTRSSTMPSHDVGAAHAAEQDAIALLEADHRAVQRLFDTFDKTSDDDPDAKATLVTRACDELAMHTIIEEEILYPAAHRALSGQPQKEVDQAYVEHFLVKTLMEKLRGSRPGDDGFDAAFKVLAENVQHHVSEEESVLFPALRKAGVDLAELGARIAQRKAQLQAKVSKDVGDRT
ncbi:hemerythrin domain-containing protein [Mycetohabitans sp. B5]|uniref:Hemerythrin HHE cation binding domain-containing protein n=2 Tax=Burkholderiaceae TaxID=119060 RepID=A0A2P5KDI6_9BURK|nr:hemerythrin domain-containing protein [Mycetohabitans sp. B5]PPB84773.1 hemerythrin HHE cation binding domain-containing protein [Mycetohabitans endofungorum]